MIDNLHDRETTKRIFDTLPESHRNRGLEIWERVFVGNASEAKCNPDGIDWAAYSADRAVIMWGLRLEAAGVQLNRPFDLGDLALWSADQGTPS